MLAVGIIHVPVWNYVFTLLSFCHICSAVLLFFIKQYEAFVGSLLTLGHYVMVPVAAN